ncbi:MAG: carboxypeptidase-like regulatory domain-containing protein [Bacteroidales bacterium]|nr:carboxypeptidase-like regulatory domain-containing protein [Bacteroidales bacterium]
MIKKVLIFSIFILFANNIFSSPLGDITITGKVINAATKEPLPYVTVALKSNIAVYTDFDGNFSITFPDKYTNDSLIVSYVGFIKRNLSIAKFRNIPNFVIELKPTDYGIENVVVVADSKSPKTIIKKANNNIMNNYVHEPFNYIFNFEKTIKQANNQTEKITGELVLFDKSGYYRSDYTKTFKSINYRFENIKRSNIVTRLAEGYVNIDDVLKADIVRNTDNVLDIKNLSDFDFSLEHDMYNGDSVWIIVYNCKEPNITNTGSLYSKSLSGELVINKLDYAVLINTSTLKLDFISDLGISFTKNNSSKNKTNVEIKHTSYYEKKNDLYALKSIEYQISYIQKENETSEEQKFTENYTLKVKKVDTNNPAKTESRQYFVE